jgi:hypothetical protein
MDTSETMPTTFGEVEDRCGRPPLEQVQAYHLYRLNRPIAEDEKWFLIANHMYMESQSARADSERMNLLPKKRKRTK